AADPRLRGVRDAGARGADRPRLRLELVVAWVLAARRDEYGAAADGPVAGERERRRVALPTGERPLEAAVRDEVPGRRDRPAPRRRRRVDVRRSVGGAHLERVRPLRDLRVGDGRGAGRERTAVDAALEGRGVLRRREGEPGRRR